MEPIKFKEANTTFFDHQKEYKPLPALLADYKDNQSLAISCWSLTNADLVNIIKHREIWVSQLTVDSQLQPIALCSNKSDIIYFEHIDESESLSPNYFTEISKMINDKHNLGNEIGKLAIFIESDSFQELHITEQELLKAQLSGMTLYHDMLEQRINLSLNKKY